MREQELNTLLSVVTDPIKNVYKLETRKDIEEVQRMVRIFNIAKEQCNEHRVFSLSKLSAMHLVLSNN